MAATSVASTTTSTTLLAQNGDRSGATITNTDANTLYVLLDSGTASATNYSVKLATDDYFELPARYRGQVTGIWAADGSGSALMTEY